MSDNTKPNKSSFEEELKDVLLNPAKYLEKGQETSTPITLNISGLLEAYHEEIISKYSNIWRAVEEVADSVGYFAHLTGRSGVNPAITHFKVGPKFSKNETLHLYI